MKFSKIYLPKNVSFKTHGKIFLLILQLIEKFYKILGDISLIREQAKLTNIIQSMHCCSITQHEENEEW